MKDVVEISNYLKAISDPTRLTIIQLLTHHRNPLCVNALAKKVNVTQSAVSQHLRILKQAGLVIGNRQGYHIHYEIDANKFQKYSNALNSIVFPLPKDIKNNCSNDC